MHVLNKLTALLVMATVASMLQGWLLYLICIVAIILASSRYSLMYFKMLRKIKWILIFIFLIFVFFTPGQYLFNVNYMMVPTYEGVQLALLHGLKLMAMVSAVACLLSSTPKQEMIGGFYQLLGIFSSLGVLDRERFSARLWLTLHYVEQRQLVLKPSALMEYIKNDAQSYVSHDATIDEVTLQIRPFNIKDLGVLFVLVTLGLLAIGSHL